MAENEGPETGERTEGDHLPGMNTAAAWLKAVAVLAILVVINVVVAFASWGWGVIITLPFTVYLMFLLGRDAIPRHRLPPGRQPPASPA